MKYILILLYTCDLIEGPPMMMSFSIMMSFLPGPFVFQCVFLIATLLSLLEFGARVWVILLSRIP